MTRRFEYVGGSSAKYWEITLVGNDMRVRFGRLGTAGQTQTKTFPHPTTAQRHVEKLIGEKTRKGYQEIVAIRT